MTSDDASHIKYLLRRGDMTRRDIAKCFGVSAELIRQIACMKVWASAPVAESFDLANHKIAPRKTPDHPFEAKLTKAQVNELKLDLLTGESMAQIAERYRVSRSTVRLIRSGKLHK